MSSSWSCKTILCIKKCITLHDIKIPLISVCLKALLHKAIVRVTCPAILLRRRETSCTQRCLVSHLYPTLENCEDRYEK